LKNTNCGEEVHRGEKSKLITAKKLIYQRLANHCLPIPYNGRDLYP
jgi:hypothetical protein